jgi:TolB protein
MRQQPFRFGRLQLLLGVLLLGTNDGVLAQPVFDLEVSGKGFRRLGIHLAAPTFTEPSAAERDLARDGRDTLGRDLIYSGFFFVLDAEGNLFTPQGVPRDWNVAGDAARPPYRVEAVWRSAAVEMRLVDAAGGQLLGKRYSIREDTGVRPAMHHFADEIVRQLTGLPGTAQTKIAFARLAGKSSSIVTVDYDGLEERTLTTQPTLSLSPCWGSGRSWLAFTSFVQGQPHLFRLDQGSNRMRVISQRPGLNTAPDWSEKRQSFALMLTSDGNAEIYRTDAEGKNPKRLTHHPAIDTSPSWSPTGDEIAFTSDRTGTPQIYVMDADGGHVRRITRHNQYSDSPAWSPDGRWIAYVCRREGGLQLVVARPDGSDERIVVRAGSSDSPAWANDSRHLAFSSRRGGVRAVYVVDLYTGLERRLSSGSHEAVTPAWSSQ